MEKEKIYGRLKEFCETKNEGTAYRNGTKPTPRVLWIMSLLDELGIDYELDEWVLTTERRMWNLYLHSVVEKPLALMAHHDIVNPESDNANDNSASVINAIAAKLERPDLLVVLTDGEEVGGLGAARYARLVLDRLQPRPQWVLNLELTGRGGKSYFIGDDIEGPLKRYLLDQHESTTVRVPFNDSVTLRKYGIDSVVINPLPLDEHGEFELWRLNRCHSMEDTLDEVSYHDMQEFVESVVLPIVDGWPRQKTGIWHRIFGWLRKI
jgi:hypothetical protein